MNYTFDIEKASENCSAETIAYLTETMEMPMEQLDNFEAEEATFDQVFRSFTRLSLIVTRRRPEIGVHCMLIHVLPRIGHLKLSAINKVAVNRLVNPLILQGKIVQAKRVFSLVKQMLSWSVFQGYLETSPIVEIPLNKIGGKNPAPRKRALTDAEVWIFWHIWDYHNTSAGTKWAARLCLLAARRPDEVLRAKKAEFNLEAGIWHQGTRNKSNRDHSLPISPLMRLCIENLIASAGDSEWLVPSTKKKGQPMSKVVIAQALRRMFEAPDAPPIEEFVPRDLRRTARSCLASLDTSPDVARKILNQSLEGIDRTYDRHDYMPQMKIALEKLSNMIQGIVEEVDVSELDHKFEGDRVDMSLCRFG
ncbi:tyrosine-type recombinase/integrase [Serratia quinivorans]